LKDEIAEQYKLRRHLIVVKKIRTDLFLETGPRRRPVLLGEQLDSLVKEFISNLRAAGGVVIQLF